VFCGLVVELDEIHQPATRSGWLAEVEISHDKQVVELPKCLGLVEEVTQDLRYYNGVIAAG
jgi:CYTH domain-containing protein